jgi:hypothetical protein
MPGSGATEIPEDVFDRVRALCMALPEVTVRVDEPKSAARSTAYSFDIRRRSFCLLVARRDPSDNTVTILVVRADADERAALLAQGAPFFPSRAGADRLGVHVTESADWQEIRELVIASYRRLAPKKLSAGLD